MSSASNSFYITTPIYYVNARPHLGHAYSTIVCDAIARSKRSQGIDTWFLTGTDEHGQKIERSAKLADRTPADFAAAISNEFRTLWTKLGLTPDDFIRTTEDRHKRGVQKLFAALRDRGYIYKGRYTGQYCVSDELYVDAPPGSPCPDCGRPTETVSEENYFFKLSAFERPLLEFYAAHPEFIQPEARRNEVIAFVRGGLKDLSVSRTSFSWGIPVPDDEKHVVYVWMDALANYITALGYGSDDPAEKARFEKFWPASVHLVGKEIIRFHCVYWPAFLLAAGLPLPKKIVAHGWLLFEESKMSKSRGNIVRAETILEAFGSLKPDAPKSEQDLFGADVLRYFLLREISFGSDGSFSFDALVQRYNSDLANGYGNLVSRTLTMITKYCGGIIASRGRQTTAFVYAPALTVVEAVGQDFNEARFTRVLTSIAAFIAITDQYVSSKTPWKLAASTDAESVLDLEEVLYQAAESIRIITALLYPILPHATAAVWQQLGLGDIELAAKNGHLTNLQWGGLQPGTKLGTLGPIFPRADKELITRMNEIEQNNAAAVPQSTEAAPSPFAVELNAASQTADAAATSITAPAVAPDRQMINIDDFMKVELRVAEIRVAERIPKSDKLLRLEVDLGTEQRQILAGIAEHYAPETLIGRRIIIVANLAPRKMRGLESQGMLLAASLGEGDKPAIASFLDSVELGARVR